MDREFDNFTRLTIEQGDLRVEFEQPYADIDAKTLLQMFYAGLIGLTFTPDTVIRAMQDFVDENQNQLKVFDDIDFPKEEE